MSKKILVLGVTGMLGSAVFSYLSTDSPWSIVGTLRSGDGKRFFPKTVHANLLANVDVLDHDALISLFNTIRPDVVINCVGLIKQLASAKDPLATLPINAMLPHRLARLCSLFGARLIHISTDCVFSGRKGMYKESDISDAEDLYGRSKYLGEVIDVPKAVTLRTSIIGHELTSQAALVNWFLAQKGSVNGFSKAIFSGLPTIELAEVLLKYVIPNEELSGLYHVSAAPIDKYSLLNLIAKRYEKSIQMIKEEQFSIDRSLDSTIFREKTGYQPPAWPELIEKMHAFHQCFLGQSH